MLVHLTGKTFGRLGRVQGQDCRLGMPSIVFRSDRPDDLSLSRIPRLTPPRHQLPPPPGLLFSLPRLWHSHNLGKQGRHGRLVRNS